MKFSSFTFLTSLFIVSSCEVVVDIDLPDQAPPLVVNSFFTPDSLMKVHLSSGLSYSSSFSERRGEFPPVNNAQLALWHETELISSSPTSLGDGIFTFPFMPENDKEYTLRVSAEGFDEVEGTDIIPKAPDVSSFSAYQAEPNANKMEVKLGINDPAGQKNFYSLYITSQHENIEIPTGNSQTFGPDLKHAETSDPVLADADFLDTEEFSFTEVYFTDDLFNGQSREITFSISGFSLNYPGHSPNVLNKTHLEIHLLAISEDLYRYKRSANQHKDVARDPFAEPLSVHSNMSNKVGIFAGYQTTVVSVSPDSLLTVVFF